MINERYISILDSIKKNGGSLKRRNVNDKILIIDGLNTFIRVFSAMPTVNDDGDHIGGIVGFLNSVGYAIKMVGPTRCIIVFDGKGGSTRRKKLYPEYKNKRSPSSNPNRVDESLSSLTDENKSMKRQLIRVLEYLETLPVSVLSISNIEADDTISYITEQLYPKSDIVIMSTDRDFVQLVNDRVAVWSPTKKILYNKETVLRDFGIPAHNYIMAKIIEGDASDNIAGVNKVGIKTIQKKLTVLLENEIVTIEKVLESIDKLDDESVSTKNLKASKELLKLNYKLMQLNNVNISTSAKLKILDIVNAPIDLMNKPKFQILFSYDKMWTTIPNVDSWLLQTYETLNSYARQTIK